MAADERPQAQTTPPPPPPPPEPPKEEPAVATATAEDIEQEETEPVFYPTDGPVTDTTITVAEGERVVEEAEIRFFHSTRQGTEAHVKAKQELEEARANLRVARKNRRY